MAALNFFNMPDADPHAAPGGGGITSCRAGKCRVEGSMVSPDTRKGRLQICEGEDGLTHVQWINRENQRTEDDLIVINDAYLERVPQCTTGRVYCLRFTSSDKKMLFWMQDADESKDEIFVEEFNRRAGGLPSSSGSSSSSAQGASSSSGTGTSASSSSSGGASANMQNLEQLRRLLAEYSDSLRRIDETAGQHRAAGLHAAPIPLSSILTNETLKGLAEDPEALQELATLMPEECTTESEVRDVLSRSSQLGGSMRGLTQALYTNSAALLSSLGVTEAERASVTSSEPMIAFAQALEQHYKDKSDSSGGGEVKDSSSTERSQPSGSGDSEEKEGTSSSKDKTEKKSS